MPRRAEAEAITIRTSRMSEIDALAHATDRSRTEIVDQAIEMFLEANRWQTERISAGVAAAEAGQIRNAEEVFGRIAAKHGWKE